MLRDRVADSRLLVPQTLSVPRSPLPLNRLMLKLHIASYRRTMTEHVRVCPGSPGGNPTRCSSYR